MSRKPIPVQLLKDPRCLLALGFGSGLARRAPGTFGSLLGALLFWPLLSLPVAWLLGAICVSFLLGIWLCEHTTQRLQVHDHPGIVWDEFVGVWFVMLWLPSDVLGVLSSFLLFRVFDILKPWPIKWLDRRVTGGFGIMIDDLLAGAYAALLAFGLIRVGQLLGFGT